MTKKNKFELGDVKEAARGNWVEIFSRFNITVPKLNSHGPCPFCGGEDRFLYDDKYEHGDWLCNVCTESKNRDGFDLIGKVTGFAFSQVIEEVASIVGLQSTSKITPAMRKQWAEERKIRERINQEMELKKQQQVSRQAQGIYRNPYPGESSPYLERKKVPALPGVKIDHKGNALIPAFDETGVMWNIQTIYPEGGKFFVADNEDPTGNKKGGRTGGCFFLIGTIDLINPIILIAEGYATAASIHLATGYPVVVAFVANNLPKVGAAIRVIYPNASIVYCADDDSAKEDTGLKYANQAVAVTGGITVLPVFKTVQEVDQSGNTEQPQASFIPSDFNDLHLMSGLGEVKTQIDLAISNSIPVSPAPPNINKPIQGQGQNENLFHVPVAVENPLAVDQGQGGGISSENVALPDDIQKFVNRYYLIETKTDVWDDYDKIVIKKNAFSALLGQKQYKLWLEHKKVILKSEFEHNVNAATNLTIHELLNNFVVLANSEEAWNLSERKTWLIKHIRIAYPNIFDMWFKSPERKIIPRQNLIFDPKQEHDHDENYINIYRGLNMDVMRDQYNEQLSRPEVFEDCQGIITLINDLCDREDIAVDFLLKWLAFPLQNIGAKMATCVLMHGHIHGSGKSLMFGTIMKKIYGEYHTTVGQAQLDNQYNEWIENKLFGVFEEIVDNKKKHNVMGMIKHLITGETLYVSKKFVSGWEMNNHLNTVFLSNNTQPLPIEEKDRRFLVLNPGKDLDGKLHEKVMGEIKTNGVQAFYTYLMGLDLSDFHEHIKPPMTRAKKTMIDYSRAGFDTFYHDWINGDTKYPYVSCKSEQLYKAFGQWSRTTGEHQISMKRFIIEGKKHGIIPSDKAKHWKGQRGIGQNKVIVIGEKPVNEQEQFWLGLQIDKFQDSLEGVNDVPEAKYA